jgi:hypothetical protein
MLASGSAPITNVTVRNNTFEQSMAIQPGTITGKIVGNIGWNGSCSDLTYSHNVWIGGDACAPTDQVVTDPGWIGDGDYRLTANSPAIDAGDPSDFPAVDLREPFDGSAHLRGARQR